MIKIKENIKMNKAIIYPLLVVAFILSAFLYSCNRENNNINELELYYSIKTGNNKIIGYEIRKIRDSSNIRNEQISIIDTVGKLLEKSLSKYLIEKSKIYKFFDSDNNFQSKKLFMIKKDTCVRFDAEDESIQVENCYLKFANLNNREVYVFKKKELAIDGIESFAYYDEKFILYREEFTRGIDFGIVLEKIDYIPKLQPNHSDIFNGR
jgi:hypothetical protein